MLTLGKSGAVTSSVNDTITHLLFFYRWDIQTLLSTIPNLGAVIDLTNTARYYDPRVSIFVYIQVCIFVH